MQITQFQISADRTQIDVTITDAATVSALRFWTDGTYKDYDLLVDLTSKLTASATENITLTLSDLELNYFDGVYFLEAEDPDEVSEAVTADLTKYKECVMNKLREYAVCTDCPGAADLSILNIQSLLEGLEDALEEGWINEILVLLFALGKFCSDECLSCGERDDITDTNYYATNV